MLKKAYAKQRIMFLLLLKSPQGVRESASTSTLPQTISKKITSIQLERVRKGEATNAFGYYDLRNISEKCNIYINAFTAYDYYSAYIWLTVIYPYGVNNNFTNQRIDLKHLNNLSKSRQNYHQDILVWILRNEKAELRLRPGQVHVSLRINNGMVQKQSFKKTADFQLGLEKYTSCTQ